MFSICLSSYSPFNVSAKSRSPALQIKARSCSRACWVHILHEHRGGATLCPLSLG